MKRIEALDKRLSQPEPPKEFDISDFRNTFKEAVSESLAGFNEAIKVRDAAILEHMSASEKIRSEPEDVLTGIKIEYLMGESKEARSEVDPYSFGSVRHMMLSNIKELNPTMLKNIKTRIG